MFNLYADVDARYMTPSRNTRSYTLRSVPSSPGRSFFKIRPPLFGSGHLCDDDLEKLEAWRFEVAHRQDKRLTRSLRNVWLVGSTMFAQVGRGGDAWVRKEVGELLRPCVRIVTWILFRWARRLPPLSAGPHSWVYTDTQVFSRPSSSFLLLLSFL